MDKDTFVFYPTFLEQISSIKSDGTQLALYRAVVNYGLHGTIPDFSDIDSTGVIDAIFVPIKYAIDEAKTRRTQQRVNGSKGGEYGKLGGNPNFSKGKPNPYYKEKDNPHITPHNPKITPTLPLNVNVNVNGNKETSNEVKKKNFSLTIESRKRNFLESINPFKEKYNSDTLNDFFSYWSEPTPSGKKMRFELQKTWDVSRRLSRWQKNNEEKRH